MDIRLLYKDKLIEINEESIILYNYFYKYYKTLNGNYRQAVLFM
ncbi:MAG TPA: hypothetical protein VI230_06660 [Ignavibacteriaceae bacterium]